jgi:glycosyltransferase involved in cell wall biosynthesis
MSPNGSSETDGAPLRILHCLRAPVGGLFRHVMDLAAEQARRGHAVGVICDAGTGGSNAAARLAALEPFCSLGISRLPIGRLPGLGDFRAILAVARIARKAGADILHGHGAKGGAYARLAPYRGTDGPVLRFYTPHGGSLHYSAGSLSGRVFLSAERAMMRHTSGLVFESAYGLATYSSKVASPDCPARIIHNGVGEEEFRPIEPAAEQADLVFVGELRALKGISVLLEAVARLHRGGLKLRAAIVGDGAERERFVREASSLGLGGDVTFHGARPARVAFALAPLLVVPSLAESLPYVVLEAAAAGEPLIATRVGGMAEIFGEDENLLVPAGNATSLADAIGAALADPSTMKRRALRLQQRVHEHFSVTRMCDEILAFYGQAEKPRH